MDNIINKLKKYFGSAGSNLNNYIPHIIGYSIFTISSIYTVMLFQSNASTTFTKTLQSVFAVVLELAKYTLPVAAIVGVIAGKKVPILLRVVAFIMALACFYYSIMATRGFQLIELQAIEANQLEQSPEYKSLKNQLKSRQEQLMLYVKNLDKVLDIEKDKKNKSTDISSTISKLQSQINSKNNELQTAINKKYYVTQTKLRTEIKQLQSTLDKNYTQLEKYGNEDVLQANDTSIKTLNNDIALINSKIDKLYIKKPTKSGYNILFTTPSEYNDFIAKLAFLMECIGIFFAIIIGLQSSGYRKRDRGSSDNGDSRSYSSPSINVSRNDRGSNVLVEASSERGSNDSKTNKKDLDVGYHSFKTYDDNKVNLDKVNLEKKPKNPIGFQLDDTKSSPTPSSDPRSSDPRSSDPRSSGYCVLKTSNESNDTTKTDNSFVFKSNTDTTPLIKGISNAILKLYIDHMYTTLKPDGSIDGMTKICRAIGISEAKGKKIFGYLENAGIVKVVGTTGKKRTIVLVSKDKISLKL